MSVVPEKQKVSRYLLLKVSGKENLLERPDIKGFEYIIEYLQDLGFVDGEGRGLSYTEIESWTHLTGVSLSSWEASILKQLSAEFASQMNKKDINEATPYKREAPNG